MTQLRPYLVALTILATALAPLAGSALNIPSFGGSSAFAAPSLAPTTQNNNNDNDDNNNNGNSNNNNGNVNNNNSNSNNNNGNDNANNNNGNSNNNNGNSNNNNGNDNGNDVDDGDDNDNQIDEVLPSSQRSSAPAQAATPVCSTPGQDMAFSSGDGRVHVKVFSSLSQSVRFSIRLPIDPASVPPAPGPVVGGLLFQLIAETCDGSPIATLPAEVNLGVQYADPDAAGLNEQNFTLARLDTSANQWRPAAKQATDPGANFTSATITEMGFYVLYPRS
jgi:hypothetical protein